jgi:predicted transcriptional regulator
MDANELLRKAEGLTVKTERGSFIRLEDLQRLLEDRQLEQVEQASKPKPKTFEQARRVARADEEIMSHFKRPTPTTDPTVART